MCVNPEQNSAADLGEKPPEHSALSGKEPPETPPLERNLGAKVEQILIAVFIQFNSDAQFGKLN